MRTYVVLFLLLATCAAAQDKPPMQLSLKNAVDLALAPEGNTRTRLARELIRQSEARSAQARSALLPDVAGSISEQSQTRNLRALGLRIQVPLPGFSFPTFVGPFDIFDARLTATQTVFDFAAIRRYQASHVGVDLARAEERTARDQVTEQVARSYLSSVRSDAVVETARANVALAEALVKLSQDQKAAGTGTGIEVTRAQVQLANERQRLLIAENDRDRAHLNLLRAMGVRLETRLELTDRMDFVPLDPLTEQQAIETARKTRSELKAQHTREENARLSYSATRWERLPSLVAFGDYGAIGPAITDAVPTRTYGVALRVPIFDGGRRDGRRAESLSQYRQEQIRTHDLAEQVELEVRLALDSLHSAENQVKTAEEGLKLAENELAQAQRRYQAGVSNSLEVTDAQTRLERARENRINALFNHNVARIDLDAAMGTIERAVQGR